MWLYAALQLLTSKGLTSVCSWRLGTSRGHWCDGGRQERLDCRDKWWPTGSRWFYILHTAAHRLGDDHTWPPGSSRSPERWGFTIALKHPFRPWHGNNWTIKDTVVSPTSFFTFSLRFSSSWIMATMSLWTAEARTTSRVSAFIAMLQTISSWENTLYRCNIL